ncbi:MAG: hypothetical protein JNL80_18425 [Phycisphaerae bacterium]|nr:hypothetical protein [Phycisphaerae bacterium]
MPTSPLELPRHWYAMTRVAMRCFAFGSLLLACSFVAWWLMLLPTVEPIRPVVAIFYDRWTLALGLLCQSLGVAAWARAWVTIPRVLPLLSLLVGIALIAITGYREVHAPASGTPQVLHAMIGLSSVVLLLFGLRGAKQSFGPVVTLFGLETEAARMARVLRWVAYVTLAFGLLLPFTPKLFGDSTPHACALRVAATGALAFAAPLLVTAASSLLFLHGLRSREGLAPACLRCGYPRPAGERCPECGALAKR